jgi:hypothetical protein
MTEAQPMMLPEQDHGVGIISKWRQERAERKHKKMLQKSGVAEPQEQTHPQEMLHTPKGVMPYETFCEKYAHMLPRADGDIAKGEIRRLTDPEEIKKAIEASEGYEPMAYVGKKSFFAVHPVQFPDGNYGLYHQIDWKFAAEGKSGCVTIPIWTDANGVKRIGLVKHFRAPVSGVDDTGGWYAEVPRFSQRDGKTMHETITGEMLKELNADVVGGIKRMDAPEDAKHGIAMENSLGSQMNPVWFVEVEPKDGNPAELQEGINGRIFLTIDEYKKALREGSITIDGQKCSTHEAHSFMALHYAEDQQLLTPPKSPFALAA